MVAWCGMLWFVVMSSKEMVLKMLLTSCGCGQMEKVELCLSLIINVHLSAREIPTEKNNVLLNDREKFGEAELFQ